MESAPIVTPSLFTFHLVTDNKQFYLLAFIFHIPPTDTMGVEDLWAAWKACPAAPGGPEYRFQGPLEQTGIAYC